MVTCLFSGLGFSRETALECVGNFEDEWWKFGELWVTFTKRLRQPNFL